jgi:hypothetical protein
MFVWVRVIERGRGRGMYKHNEKEKNEKEKMEAKKVSAPSMLLCVRAPVCVCEFLSVPLCQSENLVRCNF